MRKQVLIFGIFLLACVNVSLAQKAKVKHDAMKVLNDETEKMTVKDSDSHVLMEVNDEGDFGSISLPPGTMTGSTTNKLYNEGSTLYWNGNALGAGASEINGLSDGKTDDYSVFLGSGAGANDDGDNYNAAVGINALTSNISGVCNAAIGYNAMESNTSGNSNTAIGYIAMESNISGTNNTAIGYRALQVNTTGFENIAIGPIALCSNNGSRNVAIGSSALRVNLGSYNTVNGAHALYSNTGGSNNVCIGYEVSYYDQTGSNNTIIGYQAGKGSSLHDKSGNVFIGYQAGYNEPESNKLYIENSNSSSPLIGGDFEADELYFNGNVGIGTTSPAQTLDVSGTVQMTGFKLPNDASNGYVLTSDASGVGTWQAAPSGSMGGSGTANYIPKFTASTTLGNSLLYEDGAYVGVGTTSPERRLHVLGVDNTVAARISGYTPLSTASLFTPLEIEADTFGDMQDGFGPRINFIASDNTASLQNLGAIGIQRSGADNTGDIVFRPATTGTENERMRITSTGNVGIGTTSPSSPAGFTRFLHIEGTHDAALELSSTNFPDNKWTVGMVSASFDIRNNGNAQMRILNNGNVGIGSTSPEQLLHLGASGTPLVFEGGTDNDYETTIALTDPTADQTITFPNATGTVALTSDITGGAWESGTNGVYEDDAGVIVGIDQAETLDNAGFSLAAGNLFVQDQLGVEGDVYTDGSFVAGSSLTIGDGSISQSAGSALSVSLGGGLGDDLIVDTDVLVVESDNDRVGIGDTSPTHKLDVAGKIGVNDTQVLYLPNQTDFTGTLILGDGGSSISHTSGYEGRFNTAVGIGALNANTTGHHNTASGYNTLRSNTSGNLNVASGCEVLYYNTTGELNTASGYGALYSNTSGSNNTASGYFALYGNSTGEANTGIGNSANCYNQTGSQNTIVGYEAGSGTAWHSKSGNVFLGYRAGWKAQGDNNVFVGNQAGQDETGDNKLYIENSSSSTPLIGGDFSTDKVTINNVLILAPRSSAPTSPTEGEIYVNSSDHHIYCYLNGSWKQLDN